jgi:CRP/FNR family transcriptional regulator
MNIEKALASSTFFKGISPGSRRALAGICAVVEPAKRDTLFREGERGLSMYLLISGHVQLHKTAKDGREIVIKLLRPGEVFAEVILFEEERYPVTAVALEDCILLRLLRRDVRELLKAEDFRNDFIALLMRKQRYLAEQIRQLRSEDLRARFAWMLKEQYGKHELIHMPVSKKEFAGALGTTPESLSRLLLKLKAEGLVNWKGRTLRIAPAFWN